MSYGTVSNFEDSATVRFERTIAVPVDSVWRAIADPVALSGWLASTELDPTIGGEVHLDFGDDQRVDGRVISYEPPHKLEYTWTFTGEPDSILLFELGPAGDETRLVVEHRQLPAEQAPGYGAGWHAHLDVLVSQLVGDETIEWDQRFGEVLGAYVGA